MKVVEPLIFELSREGRVAHDLPDLDVPQRGVDSLVDSQWLRQTPAELPEVSEIDLVRHFVRLSQLNHGVDVGFYPLGSCTMKYNPKVNELVSRLGGFANLHPYQPEELAQGALELMYRLEQYLCEIAGLARVSLQPAAGAHGELTGLFIIQAYHRKRGEKRTKIIIPDSAHGTNPASAVIAGCKVVEVKSDDRGGVDLESLAALLDDDVSCLMLTNPNTLGLFDENMHRMADMVHEAGGLLYYDGANANAIMGVARPAVSGFDVVHYNLHKTFSTPHGGGGPGSGPVGVVEELVPFLPVPLVEFDGSKYHLNYDMPESVGRMKAFYGNFGVAVKAYAYIRTMGAEGLKQASEDAVLNANYLMRALQPHYDLPYDRHCMHEFVLSGSRQKRLNDVRTLDIAKRLLDHGIHPPTVYFPLIVEECMMVEPTETETLETLDRFIEVMVDIAREAQEEPEVLKSAPHKTPVGRLDETGAARNPNLRWRKQ